MDNIENTAQAIDDMSILLEETANKLRRHAQNMRIKKDFAYAAYAIDTIVGVLPSLRMDLLVTRAIYTESENGR